MDCNFIEYFKLWQHLNRSTFFPADYKWLLLSALSSTTVLSLVFLTSIMEQTKIKYTAVNVSWQSSWLQYIQSVTLFYQIFSSVFLFCFFLRLHLNQSKQFCSIIVWGGGVSIDALLYHPLLERTGKVKWKVEDKKSLCSGLLLVIIKMTMPHFNF